MPVKILWIFSGTLALVIGAIGIVVPGLGIFGMVVMEFIARTVDP